MVKLSGGFLTSMVTLKENVFTIKFLHKEHCMRCYLCPVLLLCLTVCVYACDAPHDVDITNSLSSCCNILLKQHAHMHAHTTQCAAREICERQVCNSERGITKLKFG